MYAVLFEVDIPQEKKAQYLAIAAELKESLIHIPGFISIERFASLSTPNKVLSLSYWESEAAIKKWREFECHRDAQLLGREQIFTDYRIRICQVQRDYGLTDRAQAPCNIEEKQ